MFHSPVRDRPVLQRVDAAARMAIGYVDGRTRLLRLYEHGAAKIRLPRVDAGPLEAILINTAGGLTGGDRLSWRIDVGAGAAGTVTTQACEKVYRSPGGEARVTIGAAVCDGGRLSWLPQETIVYDRSSFRRDLDVDLAGSATALLVEATIFGRTAMGEVVAHADFRDRWRVRRDGRLVHAEEFALGPDVAGPLKRATILNGVLAMATILRLGPEQPDLLEALRALVGPAGGVSVWSVAGTGKLLARLVAPDGLGLRRRLVPIISVLNDGAGVPKAWSL